MKPFVLAIKFTTSPEHRTLFKEILIELFNTISAEPTFFNAVLHEGTENAHEILVYETWNEQLRHGPDGEARKNCLSVTGASHIK